MGKLAFPLFFLLLWLFSAPSEIQGQWQSPAEQKAFDSYPLENIYTSAPVSELLAYKPKVLDPYEVNPLFQSRAETTASESLTTGGQVIAKNGTLAETTGKPEELVEEDSEEESEEETKHEEKDEKPSEGDRDEEDSEAGEEKEAETSQEESSGAGGGQEGPVATKTADQVTKTSGLDFINLIGSDFQPGRLVNIFFGIILLMFMMIAQGYMMWVFGIAFLPGTRRSLDDWKVNTEVLDRAMEILVDAFEYWNEAKLKEVETIRRRR